MISNLMMLFVSKHVDLGLGRRHRIGRRWAMMIPAADRDLRWRRSICSAFSDPLSIALLIVAFAVQGFFAGAVYGQNPSYLNERFPTEVRATAAGFCYHQGAIWGGSCARPLLAAVGRQH